MRQNFSENKTPEPLEKRVYKGRKPKLAFFCPLCRTQRYLSTLSRLSKKNYFQLFVASVFGSLVFYPLMKERSLLIFFFIWITWELFLKLHFRKEVPCPHCGFDATWYRRDVKVAKKLVQDFWKRKLENNQ